MWHSARSLVGALTSGTGRMVLAASVFLPTTAVAGGVAGESIGLFVDGGGVPVLAAHDGELDAQTGLGLVAGDGVMSTEDLVAVILWDEAKPRRLHPDSGLSVGASGASVAVSSGGRTGP